MAGPDKNTHRIDTGGDSPESSQPLSQAASGGASKSMNEQDRDAAPLKAGMAVETKMGMGIVIILVCAFGFLVYHKFDLKQRALLQASMQGNRTEADSQVFASSPAEQASMALQSSTAADSPAAFPAAAAEAVHSPSELSGEPPALEFTEPVPEKVITARNPETAPAQNPSVDPFAALAARNAARVAQEAKTSHTVPDDPFASVPMPATEPKRLFPDAPPSDEPSQQSVADTPATAVFPPFGDAGETALSPDLAAKPTPVPVATDLASHSGTSEAASPSEFEGAAPDTLQVTTSEATTQPGSLPPAFPDGHASITTVAAAPGQHLPPVSSFDPLPTASETASPESTRKLRPVDEGNQQLIAMLEPQPGVSPFADTLPSDKPGPALFSVSDEQIADSGTPSTATPEFSANTAARSFDTSPDNAAVTAGPDYEGTLASQFSNAGAAADTTTELKPKSRRLSEQDATLPHGTAGAEIGVARFHNPRQIQLVAGASDPCEICEVRVNDNYWTISKRTYGTARYFSSLALYNQHRIADPKKLRPGMKVLIPAPGVLEKRYPEFFRNQQRKAAQPSGYFLKADGTPAYRVGERETLSEISQKHLGRASRWIQIYRLNQQILKDPNRLKLGTVIVLPDDATDVHLAP
ncbi:MAG: LysM peptidoglycan-binding domain-containing protein [Fuerstiella sp.]|nr:LysM peptidoglycan-binding domain-containing protein [Fuerstiella sp.]